MEVTVHRVSHRPDKPSLPRRVIATVDGHRVSFRSDAHRGWSCHVCGIHDHAVCAHTSAVREVIGHP